MDDLESTEPAPSRPVGFMAVSFGGCEALGGDCSFTLDPQRTVLVGRNGCGKSLLLETLVSATAEAFGDRHIGSPTRLSAKVSTQEGEVSYKYEYQELPDESNRKSERNTSNHKIVWQEEGSVEGLWNWTVQNGILTTPYNDPIHLPDHVGILQTDLTSFKYASSLARFGMVEFSRRIANVVLKHAKFPRTDDERGPVFIEQTPTARSGMSRSEKPRHAGSYLYRLGEKIIETNLGQGNKQEGGFLAIAEVGRRIGAWQQIEVQEFNNNLGRIKQTVRTIVIDGVNYGYASDGTLRILDLLSDLIGGPRDATILIDEPELGIHPGMLSKLLAEFDAYSEDKQIIVATHSPQVVSWAKPEHLRIVERLDGRTNINPVTESQSVRIAKFLQQDGSLGDFTYGGGFDD